MTTAEAILTWTQIALLAPLAVLALHRGWMVALSSWTWRRRAVPPDVADAELPRVTVQLPIFNERYVAARLCRVAARLDYPRDRLQIQVLDDSTDDTAEIVARAIRALPADLDVQHLRRRDREGFKAGALAAGLQRADGELVAVFDADFLPPADFLRRTVPWTSDPRVGMVQARWDHLNHRQSLLTDLQATLLDGHFLVEHPARAHSGAFFNFNGTAGLFRRACIEDAGGWQHDTLTEDMDLSYRAQLRGWRFVYLPDLACPAELPVDMSSFLNQQHRWAKGSVQTARKLLGRILRAPVGALTKVEATFHLLGNLAFPLLFGLILVALPLQLARLWRGGPVITPIAVLEALPILLATACVLLYYGVARRRAGRFGLVTVLRLPLVLAIGAGMCISNTTAVLGALRRHPGEFHRTPKRGGQERSLAALPFEYRSRRGLVPLVEIALGAWAASTACVALSIGLPATALFHGLFALGLCWTGGASLLDGVTRTRQPELTPSSA